MDSGIVIERVQTPDPATIAGLADVTVDCVSGGASIGFMEPFGLEEARAFWTGVSDRLADGGRLLYVARDADGIVGTVQGVFAEMPNQPHRADIAKMQVHRRARKQGVGAKLIAGAENGARDAGRTILVLDTVTGSDAYRLYQKLGYQRVGEIPDFALWPDGGFCPTTFFWKRHV